MSDYRIEFRSYNVGAGGMLGAAGTGAAHNFLVLVEVLPDGTTRHVAELHGESIDPKTGDRIPFDAICRGRLEMRSYDRKTGYHSDSENRPKFTLFRGSEKEARARFAWAEKEGQWINRQNFRYDWRRRNSNSVANTIARAAGFNVTGQPIDPDNGAHLPAPGRELDLRDEARRPREPDEIVWMERINGYGVKEKPLPARPRERQWPARLTPAGILPTQGQVPAPAESTAASYRLVFENARRFADEHRFDPRAEAALSEEQNRLVSAWIERALAPAISYAELPEGLAGDLLDHAARLTPHAASLVLQKGLNRLAGPAEVAMAAPAFTDGAAKRVTEDGWIGPETLAAARNHTADSGLTKVREAVALAAFERGLDGLINGEAGADEAPSVFHRSIGRLFRAPDGVAGSGGFAARRPTWASVSRPGRDDVATLQDALNDANRIFGFADRPLLVDGDLGPKTGAALVAAARTAGPERLTDHLGKRLGIGEPDLMDNPARGFGYALDGEEEQERRDDDASPVA